MHGHKIRQARKDMNLTLQSLSDLTGIHCNQISRFETDKRMPTFDQIIILAFFLEVSIYYFITPSHPYRDTLLKLERII